MTFIKNIPSDYNVKVATTTDLTIVDLNGVPTLTLSSPLTQLDGVNIQEGDRILIKDGVTWNTSFWPQYNGIYYVSNSSLTTLTRISRGALNEIVYVSEGTDNSDSNFVVLRENVPGPSSSLVNYFYKKAEHLGIDASGNLSILNLDNSIYDVSTKNYVDNYGGSGLKVIPITNHLDGTSNWSTDKKAIWKMENAVGQSVRLPEESQVTVEVGDTFNYVVTGANSYEFTIGTSIKLYENGTLTTGYTYFTKTDRYQLNRYLYIDYKTWTKI